MPHRSSLPQSCRQRTGTSCSVREDRGSLENLQYDFRVRFVFVAGSRLPIVKRGEARMQVSNHEMWALVHGMGIGGLFLLGFSGGLVALWSLRSELLTTTGVAERVRRLRLGTGVMALMAWLTVLTGAWI